MSSVFVAWQDANSHEWIPVARLQRESVTYRLTYLRGATRATGFAGFGRMSDFEATYESPVLFSPFANRIMSRSRPEYDSYLRWAGLSRHSDTLEVLAVTGGVRGTDSVEIFAPPVRTEAGHMSMRFFVRGLRHLPQETMAALEKFQPGQQLLLLSDLQNSFNGEAMALRSDLPAYFLGFCPNYYCGALKQMSEQFLKDLTVRVVQVNPDAPFGMRLLCEASAKISPDFDFFTGNSDFLPLSNASVAEVR